jgi:hypothetical protein
MFAHRDPGLPAADDERVDFFNYHFRALACVSLNRSSAGFC